MTENVSKSHINPIGYLKNPEGVISAVYNEEHLQDLGSREGWKVSDESEYLKYLSEEIPARKEGSRLPAIKPPEEPKLYG